MDEYRHDRGDGVLLSQFFGATGGVVGHVGAQVDEVGDHPIKTPAGADTLFISQFLIGHAVLAIKFSPGALDDNITEGGSHPVEVMICEIVGTLYA